jgi:hypothetical protein
MNDSLMNDLLISLMRSHFEETAMQSDRDGVSSVVCFELGQNVPDMSFNSVLADIQAVCHNFVRAALRYEFQDFYFPSRQGLIGGVLP